SFVRDAPRQEFWTSPLVRALLGLICLALVAALSLQWMVRQKDVLAAQEPRLAPWLQAMCRPLGCAIRPLRRIESLVIDSASFTKTGPHAYRLTFVLRNTGAAVLEIPALEVTLTDSQEQTLVRRVVMPAQFGATAITLDAYSELAGILSLKVMGETSQRASSSAQAGLLSVSGYRILAFYP
ncbi:MAG: family finger-like protein, partial [Polaromonas sp.]|nr:family finger-like protein [Polaromonas sp.]